MNSRKLVLLPDRVHTEVFIKDCIERMAIIIFVGVIIGNRIHNSSSKHNVSAHPQQKLAQQPKQSIRATEVYTK
jgi:hypothetical protein